MEGSQLASLQHSSWGMMGASTGRPGDERRICPSVLPWNTPGFVCLSSSPSSALPYLSPGREGAVIYQGYWLLTDTGMAAAATQHSAASF